jgi:hypothetical protein
MGRVLHRFKTLPPPKQGNRETADAVIRHSRDAFGVEPSARSPHPGGSRREVPSQRTPRAGVPRDETPPGVGHISLEDIDPGEVFDA